MRNLLKRVEILLLYIYCTYSNKTPNLMYKLYMWIVVVNIREDKIYEILMLKEVL